MVTATWVARRAVAVDSGTSAGHVREFLTGIERLSGKSFGKARCVFHTFTRKSFSSIIGERKGRMCS